MHQQVMPSASSVSFAACTRSARETVPNLKNKLHISETDIHALAPERVVELAQDYFARPKS